MADIIQNKINSILGDGARPTKFKCHIYPPEDIRLYINNNNSGSSGEKSNIQAAECMDYFCFSASFPGMNVNTLDFKYRGKNIPLKSTFEFEQKWTATFYNDENHNIRKMFFDWAYKGQKYRYDSTSPNLTKTLPTSISIYQLNYEMDRDCVVYTMFNVFPVNISSIEVAYENINAIETFTVEFSYSHFEINTVPGVGLNADDISSAIKNTINNIANSIKESVIDFGEELISPVTDIVQDSFETFLG